MNEQKIRDHVQLVNRMIEERAKVSKGLVTYLDKFKGKKILKKDNTFAAGIEYGQFRRDYVTDDGYSVCVRYDISGFSYRNIDVGIRLSKATEYNSWQRRSHSDYLHVCRLTLTDGKLESFTLADPEIPLDADKVIEQVRAAKEAQEVADELRRALPRHIELDKY